MIHPHLDEISYLLYTFMIFGVIASSVSGALRAIEAKMDITGAILLAFITGNAGGTVRDLILGTTVFWITNQFYIWLTFIVGCITFILIYYKREVIGNLFLHRALITTDAMGLAAFSLAGVEKTLSLGQNYALAIIMGIWTAIGGGIVGDIISNRVPLVLSQELYITVAFVGSISYLVLLSFLPHIIASIIAAILMVLLRIYSVKFNWRFPTI